LQSELGLRAYSLRLYCYYYSKANQRSLNNGNHSLFCLYVYITLLHCRSGCSSGSSSTVPSEIKIALTYRLQTLHHSFQDTLTGSHLALARTTSWYTCFEVLVGALSLSHINILNGRSTAAPTVGYSYTDLLAVMCWQFQGLDYSH
jgi:hypothetical protein